MTFYAADEYGVDYLGGSIYIDSLADPVPSSLSTMRPFNAAPNLRGPYSAVLGKVLLIIQRIVHIKKESKFV